MKVYVQGFGLSLLMFLMADAIWLGLIQRGKWNEQVKLIQGSDMKMRMVGAVFAYLVMAICMSGLVVSRARGSFFKGAINGFLLGLAMYGVFNGVNYAIFMNYRLETARLDLLWGLGLCTVVGGLVSYLS